MSKQPPSDGPKDTNANDIVNEYAGKTNNPVASLSPELVAKFNAQVELLQKGGFGSTPPTPTTVPEIGDQLNRGGVSNTADVNNVAGGYLGVPAAGNHPPVDRMSKHWGIEEAATTPIEPGSLTAKDIVTECAGPLPEGAASPEKGKDRDAEPEIEKE